LRRQSNANTTQYNTINQNNRVCHRLWHSARQRTGLIWQLPSLLGACYRRSRSEWWTQTNSWEQCQPYKTKVISNARLHALKQ